MLTGILLAVAAGFIWSLSGVANSSCARFKLDIVTYLLTNVTISLILTTVFFCRFSGLTSGNILWLGAVMIPAGIMNTAGALCLQRALQLGHHGIVFLISQSALVMPFLFGILIMGEKAEGLRCLGAALIVFGMICCSLPKIDWRNLSSCGSSGWLWYALGSFMLFGIAQSMMTLPSYWKNFPDAAGLRTSFLYLGSTFIMMMTALRPSVRSRLSFNRILILCGGIVSVMNVFSMQLIFTSLSHLARNGMTAVGFPLAIASSLVAFTLYSLLFLREKVYVSTIAGLILIICGGCLIS